MLYRGDLVFIKVMGDMKKYFLVFVAFLLVALCFCVGSSAQIVPDPPEPVGVGYFPIVKADGDIRFYIKGSATPTRNYLEYRLKHFIKPYDATFSSINHNLDSWNLFEVYETERVEGFNFVRLRGGFPIVSGGAWECAIKETGAADFIGGSNHGDEVLIDAQLYVDGKQKDLLRSEKIYGQELIFIHHSTLFRSNTLKPVADYVRTYNVSVGGIVLTQEIKWLEPLEVSDSYLAMLPIRRNLNGETGELITEVGVRDDGAIEDLSSPGFVPVYTIGTQRAKAWSIKSGIYASVQILEDGGGPPAEFNFSNSPAYNKFYFDFTQRHMITAGEIWQVSTKYFLDTVN